VRVRVRIHIPMITYVGAIVHVGHNMLDGMEFSGHLFAAHAPATLIELRGSSFTFPVSRFGVADLLQQWFSHCRRYCYSSLQLRALENIQDGVLNKGNRSAGPEQSLRGRAQGSKSIDNRGHMPRFFGRACVKAWGPYCHSIPRVAPRGLPEALYRGMTTGPRRIDANSSITSGRRQ
jgi:hypothetical protein